MPVALTHLFVNSSPTTRSPPILFILFSALISMSWKTALRMRFSGNSDSYFSTLKNDNSVVYDVKNILSDSISDKTL